MSGTRVRAARWMTIQTAAELLDMSEEALRRALERRAVRAPDGGVEADLDGVCARKLGRQWRVCFSERWWLDIASPRERTGT